jgi:hypothetical protein
MRRPSHCTRQVYLVLLLSYYLVPRLILMLHNEMVKHKPNWHRKELKVKTPPPELSRSLRTHAKQGNVVKLFICLPRNECIVSTQCSESFKYM